MSDGVFGGSEGVFFFDFRRCCSVSLGVGRFGEYVFGVIRNIIDREGEFGELVRFV